MIAMDIADIHVFVMSQIHSICEVMLPDPSSSSFDSVLFVKVRVYLCSCLHLCTCMSVRGCLSSCLFICRHSEHTYECIHSLFS